MKNEPSRRHREAMDAVREAKCHIENVKIKKQCEAMATQINFAIQNDNTSFMLPRFQQALKAYEKFKENKDD